VRPTFEGVFFGPTDDVPEGNGGHPSAFASPTGRLFFATVAGLAVFDGTPPIRREGQRVLLEGASDRGRPLPMVGEAIVGPGGGPVEFQFSAPNIADADNTLVKYQLVGRDREWVLARSRFARYSYLAPGRYQFQLMARDESGAWSAPVTAMRLQVLASWWQAWWVRLLGALLATTAVGGFVQWRIHQMRRANLALSHEIAERKRAEELSKRHLLELAHVSRLATAGELTATLTHELGQPLTAIGASAEASRLMLAAKADPAEVDAALADITTQSQRASEVVRGLRTFLRRGATLPTALDLNDEILEVVRLVKSTLDAALVTLSLDLTDDELWVTAERIPLQQVLLNLMVNAAEAMRTSGSPRRLLLVRSTRQPGAARVSVVDSGPGVAASQRTRVFEAFQTTKPEGMGIGLSICKSIVEAHGGRIATRNLPRCGAVFSFTLPSSPQGPAAYTSSS
jgi:C4-dicarboxylate-specific signal transduction histidine kinase